MSQKKGSRAERAVSQSRKNASGQTKKKSVTGPAIPIDWITAFICLALFALFLIMAINPEGPILQAILSFLMGTIGQVGFYFSIPALFFLFFIHTFGRKSKVRMRSLCLIAFVLLCSCIHHLIQAMLDNTVLNAGFFPAIAGLYEEGKRGSSGGVLCGGLITLATMLLGNILPMVLCVVGAILTLLGSLKITIPSIIRAIQERPREDWEDEKDVEPAAVVVNHIANKQLENKRRLRERQLAAMEQRAEAPAVSPSGQRMNTENNRTQSIPAPEAQPIPHQEGNAARENVLSQIALEIDTPLGSVREVSQAKQADAATGKKPHPAHAAADEQEEPVSRMPELDVAQLKQKKKDRKSVV